MKTIESIFDTVDSRFALGRGLARPKAARNLLAGLVLTSFLFAGIASAQSGSDQSWYRTFINSVGKTLFFCAWPTDTFDHLELSDIQLRSDGADVTVRLFGKSWLEGKLWTDVVVEIRGGEVKNLRWGRYDALIPPGTTLSKTKEWLDKLNDDYKRQQNMQPVAVLCLNNSTAGPIVYSLPSEGISSQTLAPGQTWMFWHGGSPNFTVSFRETAYLGPQKSVLVKGVLQASKPASCDVGMIYNFVQNDQRMGLTPRTWIAGTEDPFTPHLVRGSEEGKWVCADGYKWASPDNLNDTTCVSNDTGLLGVSLQIDPGDSYPRIVTIRAGGPASRAYVPAGSYLMEVNGQSMRGLSIDDVVSRIRGPINTFVRIAVTIPGRDQMEVFDLRRE